MTICRKPKGRLRACPFLFSGVLLAGLACGQEIRLYSEFQRIDPFGEVIAADRIEKPREILSPAVLRNGFNSFHVVVSVAAGVPYALHVAQNPDNVVQPSLYREKHKRVGDGWVPDELTPVDLPITSTIAADVPGRKVDVFWLDLHVKARTPVERIRVELQLNVNDRWIIYPMEVRVTHPVVPANLVSRFHASADALPADSASSDAPANLALREYLCGQPPKLSRPTPTLTIFKQILRNAVQDMALVRQAEAGKAAETARPAVLAALGAPDGESWCADPSRFRPAGPETWLKLRNAIWKLE